VSYLVLTNFTLFYKKVKPGKSSGNTYLQGERIEGESGRDTELIRKKKKVEKQNN